MYIMVTITVAILAGAAAPLATGFLFADQVWFERPDDVLLFPRCPPLLPERQLHRRASRQGGWPQRWPHHCGSDVLLLQRCLPLPPERQLHRRGSRQRGWPQRWPHHRRGSSRQGWPKRQLHHRCGSSRRG